MKPSWKFPGLSRAARWQRLTGIALAVLLLAGTAVPVRAAIVSRNILKSFFTPGAKPTSAQFTTLIDSILSISDDRYLLGLKQYDPTRTYLGGDLLDTGTIVDSNMLFGPAEGLADVWTGRSGFLGLAFTEGTSPDPHYGYLQIAAGGPTDPYPMFVEALVYEDQANTPLAITAVPEPSSLLLAGLGFAGLAAWRFRRRKPNAH